MLEVQGMFDETLDVEYAKRAVDKSTGLELAFLDRERDARVRALSEERINATREGRRGNLWPRARRGRALAGA